MKIANIEYSINTKSFDIFLSGCSGNPKCDDCYNEELWDFNIGEECSPIVVDKIINSIHKNKLMIDNIRIMGGEPLDQDIYELKYLLRRIMFNTDKKIWLFTRFNIKEIQLGILQYCNYVKCGKYISNLKCDDNIQYGVKLATSNQYICAKGKDYLW